MEQLAALCSAGQCRSPRYSCLAGAGQQQRAAPQLLALRGAERHNCCQGPADAVQLGSAHHQMDPLKVAVGEGSCTGACGRGACLPQQQGVECLQPRSHTRQHPTQERCWVLWRLADPGWEASKAGKPTWPAPPGPRPQAGSGCCPQSARPLSQRRRRPPSRGGSAAAPGGPARLPG